MKISFIGYGNMAKAIIASLDDSYQIHAASPSLDVTQTTKMHTTHSNLGAIKEAEMVILAIKPAILPSVLEEIGRHLPAKCVLISVAAGITLKQLQHYCKPLQAIVRAMPNTPLAVGKGATPLIANAYTSSLQKQSVESLFKRAGIVTWVENENKMDIFTALSGSGPAYAFLFLDALITSAVDLGLDEETARLFSLQTVEGAVQLLAKSPLSATELREKVTSPAGTTAAALAILQQNGFKKLIKKAMQAAVTRAQQLGSN